MSTSTAFGRSTRARAGTPHRRRQARSRGRVLLRPCGQAMLASLLALCGPLAADLREPNATHRVATAASAFVDIPAPALGLVSSALGSEDPAFAALTAGGALRFVNRRAQLTADFGRHGLRLVNRRGERMSMTLAAFGFGDALQRAAPATPLSHANRIEYRRGAVREWYVNGPAGIEQGFTIARLARSRSSAPLTLALSGTAGVRLDPDGRGLSFPGFDGTPSVRYSDLWATDARGQSLRAWLETRGEQILIRVDSSHARFPVTIDPMFEAARLSGMGQSAYDRLGAAVAVDGDTIVAGAPNAGSKGAVYVFVKPATGWSNAALSAKLTASSSSSIYRLGRSVAVSGDSVVTAGDYGDGGVLLFRKPVDGWTNLKETATLTPTNASGSLVVAANGRRVAAADRTGHVFVFNEPATGWASKPEDAVLTTSDAVSALNFGVAIAMQGSTIVVGQDGNSYPYYPGSVYVFERGPDGWLNGAHETAKLTASDGSPNRLGSAVAIASNVIFAGASRVIYVFIRPTGGWANRTEDATLSGLAGDIDGDIPGAAVALTDRYLIGGTQSYSAQPFPFLYPRPSGDWTSGAATSRMPLAAIPQNMSYDATSPIAADGATAAVGVPWDDVESALDIGSVRVLVEDATPPLPPMLSRTTPGSPSRSSTPSVVGTAESHAAVDIYGNAACSGQPLAHADAATLASAGVPVMVPGNQTTRLSARATDRAGNVSTCSPPLTYTADTTPPVSAITAGPQGPSGDATPTFQFAADDPAAIFECSLDGAAFTRCATPFTTAPLAERIHTFALRATDLAGNSEPTPTFRTFVTDISPPRAIVTATPTVTLTGEPIGFDASSSTDPPAALINHFEWDLDGNGTFETDTAAGPRASLTYRAPGDLRPAVRVTDEFGRSATARVRISVRRRPPRGSVGVVINGGSRSTSSRKVRLGVTWPAFATTMSIAENRRMERATTTAVQPSISWRFSGQGSRASRRTVYVRFDSSSRVYRDTIVVAPGRGDRK